MDFNNILTHLKRIEADPNVTITTNATESFGEAALVQEQLKQALNEAEKLLSQHYDKRTTAAVIDRTRDLISDLNVVDERPGLALFVNAMNSKVVNLPFRVQQRVTVGSTFYTRELLRAGLDSIGYHVLRLSSDNAQLYEAQDAHLLHEVRGAFPLRNDHYTTDVIKLSTSRGQVDQAKKYHKEVDAAVRDVVGSHGLVVVACVSAHYGHFIKSVPAPDIYLANLQGNYDHIAEREMILQAWELVHAEQKRRHLAEFAQLAETSPRISNIVDDIWEQVREGRGHILFVERDKHQPAMLEGEHAILVDDSMDHEPGIDLIDAIIEEQIGHGGEIRIVPNGALAEFGGIALKPRY